MLLTEVGLDNGGRSVTIRSLFEVRNATTHPIKLVFNPDPRYRPDLVSIAEELVLQDAASDDNDERSYHTNHTQDTTTTKQPTEYVIIGPGDAFQLPTLLIESALEMSGSHLGSIWLCPDTKNQNFAFRDFSKSTGSPMEQIEASFCSRPVQLAKIVHETSQIFQNGTGDDIPSEDAKSGVQVACPTRSRKGDGQAPFCYAVEVARSPIVNFSRDKTITDAKDPKEISEKEMAQVDASKSSKKEKKAKSIERVHGPVVYSLSIHAPIVIVNLLPEGGRFELMHAIRKTVVWYADLQPGQQIPVHSIGLDAPLLLLVNLGFCRTPVGEGALVHHGGDAVFHGKGKRLRMAYAFAI
jgi:hypothetical protein